MNQDSNEMSQFNEPLEEKDIRMLDRMEDGVISKVTRQLLSGPTVGKVAAERGSAVEAIEIDISIDPDVPLVAALMIMREINGTVAEVPVDGDYLALTRADMESFSKDIGQSAMAILLAELPEGFPLTSTLTNILLSRMRSTLEELAKGLLYKYVCLGKEGHKILSNNPNLGHCTRSPADHNPHGSPGVKRA